MSDPHQLNWNMTIALGLHCDSAQWSQAASRRAAQIADMEILKILPVRCRRICSARKLLHSLENRAPDAFLNSTVSVPQDENAMNEFSLFTTTEDSVNGFLTLSLQPVYSGLRSFRWCSIKKLRLHFLPLLSKAVKKLRLSQAQGKKLVNKLRLVLSPMW